MHNEITLSVKSKNNVARYIFLGLIGTAIIFIIAANLGLGLSGILWMIALGFITAAIYVYNGHVAAEYYYEIRNDGGRESFVVNMAQPMVYNQAAEGDRNGRPRRYFLLLEK